MPNTFASRAHSKDKGNKQVKQHPFSPLLISERWDHVTEREILLQGLRGRKQGQVTEYIHYLRLFISVYLRRALPGSAEPPAGLQPCWKEVEERGRGWGGEEADHRPRWRDRPRPSPRKQKAMCKQMEKMYFHKKALWMQSAEYMSWNLKEAKHQLTPQTLTKKREKNLKYIRLQNRSYW